MPGSPITNMSVSEFDSVFDEGERTSMSTSESPMGSGFLEEMDVDKEVVADK